MAFQQTFDSSKLNISGLMDVSTEMASKAREVGAEMMSLSVRNFESAAKAGRELTGVRDLSEAARIQSDYLKNVMTAFTEHSTKIAEIVMAGAKQAGAEAKAATENAMAATTDASRTVLGQTEKLADKGLDAARKF